MGLGTLGPIFSESESQLLARCGHRRSRSRPPIDTRTRCPSIWPSPSCRTPRSTAATRITGTLSGSAVRTFRHHDSTKTTDHRVAGRVTQCRGDARCQPALRRRAWSQRRIVSTDPRGRNFARRIRPTGCEVTTSPPTCRPGDRLTAVPLWRRACSLDLRGRTRQPTIQQCLTVFGTGSIFLNDAAVHIKSP